jgi:serine O-acetyltransferase (EC 2.3.1.30)
VLKDSKTQTDHFESYAVGTDVDDPTVKAINSILSHIHDMDEQLNIVSKKLDIKDQDDIDVDKLEIESKLSLSKLFFTTTYILTKKLWFFT